jgi:hypothetical protein
VAPPAFFEGVQRGAVLRERGGAPLHGARRATFGMALVKPGAPALFRRIGKQPLAFGAGRLDNAGGLAAGVLDDQLALALDIAQVQNDRAPGDRARAGLPYQRHQVRRSKPSIGHKVTHFLRRSTPTRRRGRR